MAWEENSRICLHMQLIAILSRIGVYSLNIFNINKEMMLLIHTKTTKHSLSFASHSAYCRHAEILLRVIKESTTSVLSLV